MGPIFASFHRSAALLATAGLILTLILGGCGVRGDVVPAWEAKAATAPVAVTDLKAEVRFNRIWLTFTEPSQNTDESVPARLDRYIVYYEEMPIDADYCLTCPLNLSQKKVVDPSVAGFGNYRFDNGQAEVGMMEFDPAKKFVFVVIALAPDDRSAGDSNVATLNWPTKAKSGKSN